MNKNFLFILLASFNLLSSCKIDPAVETNEKPFKHVFDFEAEAKRLDSLVKPTVIKTLINKGKKETIEITPESWLNKELAPFIALDFNLPKLKDKYSLSVNELPFAGKKTYLYTALDEKLTLQKAEYTYVNNKLATAYLLKKVENNLSNSEQVLLYTSNEGYTIRNRQKVNMAFDEEYLLQVQFKNAAKQWIGNLDLGDQQLPIRFNWQQNESNYNMQIINAAEQIEVSSIESTEDSLRIQLPVFLSYFNVKLEGDSMKGYWYDPSRNDQYKIPFSAHVLSEEEKLIPSLKSKAPSQMAGRWETTFGESDKALGLFEQHWGKVYGTFATETGDYRYLEGTVDDDQFTISTFDGSHAFLFTGTIKDDSLTNGIFYSGNHYSTPWKAKINQNFELRHADSLTSVKPDAGKMAFTFPDLEGNSVSLSDEKYQNKVVLVSIFGSWCPNCMDETRYYGDLYRKYNAQGLEIIGLAFERTTDFEKAKKAVSKSKVDLNAPYDFLIAGKASKKAAAEALPMLNHVLSFPTTIFLNRKGEVVKIHTGFYGPGTGKYYSEYQNDTEQFIEQLLTE